MCVDEIPVKNRMKDHFPWCTKILCGMWRFPDDPGQCLQSSISLIHAYKINGKDEKYLPLLPEVIHKGFIPVDSIPGTEDLPVIIRKRIILDFP